jgi:hypothetical protein
MTTIAEARPEVDVDEHTPPEHVYDIYRHEDGSVTYIVLDQDSGHCNPREDDGNVATLINRNDRHIDIDTDDAGLQAARDRFDGYGVRGWSNQRYGRGARSRYDREDMVQRYIRIFRPDIVHYADRWDYGREGYGWGYVTREAWREHMFPTLADDATDEEKQAWLDYEPGCTPEEAFDAEVKLHGEWAEGDVFGYVHVSIDKPIVVLGEQGAYVDGYTTTEDSCWGFLGYDDHKEIAMQATDSPITEVLH